MPKRRQQEEQAGIRWSSSLEVGVGEVEAQCGKGRESVYEAEEKGEKKVVQDLFALFRTAPKMSIPSMGQKKKGHLTHFPPSAQATAIAGLGLDQAKKVLLTPFSTGKMRNQGIVRSFYQVLRTMGKPSGPHSTLAKIKVVADGGKRLGLSHQVAKGAPVGGGRAWFMSRPEARGPIPPPNSKPSANSEPLALLGIKFRCPRSRSARSRSSNNPDRRGSRVSGQARCGFPGGGNRFCGRVRTQQGGIDVANRQAAG